MSPRSSLDPIDRCRAGRWAVDDGFECREGNDITDEEAGILSGLGPDALKRASTAHRVGSVAKRVAKALSTPITGCYNNVKVRSLIRQRR